MRYRAFGALFLFTVVLVAGCEEEDRPPGFFEGKPQATDQRQVHTMPPARDSVRLLDLDVFEFGDFFVQGDALYLPKYNDTFGKALAVNKKTLTPERVIGRGEGQGPGEVQVAGTGVARGRVVFYSPRQRKIAVYDTSGTWVTDIRPGIYLDNVAPLANRFVVMNTVSVVEQEGRPPLFLVVDGKEQVVDRFGPSGRPEVARSDNPIAYTGKIAAGPDGAYLYFGGYSEALLKKYEIGGEQVFSVKTIDNLPSEVNYLTPQSNEEVRMWGYAEHGLFSVKTLAVFGRYLLVGPINDIEGNTLTYIDVYRAEDGAYVRSYRMPNFVEALAVDESGIYTEEESEGEMYLKAYENVLRERSE